MSLAVGDTLSAPAQKVRPEMMHLWAKVLRDPNPIHTDVEAVRARGWGDRVINQGPGNVSYIMNLLLDAFPCGRLAEIKMRFLDNVRRRDGKPRRHGEPHRNHSRWSAHHIRHHASCGRPSGAGRPGRRSGAARMSAKERSEGD